ncbi:hypothetical protein CL634_04470 [bacterium]|nr:hypothetical protein [bacterium]
MSKKIILSFSALAITAGFILPTSVNAQRTEDLIDVGLEITRDRAGLSKPDPEQDTLPRQLGRIINYFFGIIGVVFMLWILVGAYEWMTSGGAEEKVTEAKKKIIAAINGIIITFLAYALSFIIVASLSGALKSGGAP